MKIIEIKFEGVVRPRYSVIKKEDNHGFCQVSDKANQFILAQSQDNNVYYGTTQYYCNDLERAENIICRSNGDISTYHIKHDVIDTNDPFATPKTDKFEWRKIELRTIDVME